MIEPDLLQFITGTPGDGMFYVSTVEEALRWRIEIDGVPTSANQTWNQLHYACENALANRISLTSVLDGVDGILGDAFFLFQPLNKYSIQEISSAGDISNDGTAGVASLRAGYSSVGCRVRLLGEQVAVCGDDEATDTQVGRCGEDYGMRYFSPLSRLHPKTRLQSLGLPDAFNADARRIATCETFDRFRGMTDSQPCLQTVVLLQEAGNPMARHVFTWPSGSRTVIEIDGAAYGETHTMARINGGSGEIRHGPEDKRCVRNFVSGNLFFA